MARKKTEDELFQEWKEAKAAELSDESREKFLSFAAGDDGKKIFKGYLMQEEFHRRANELHNQKLALEADEMALNNRVAEVEKWYQENAPVNENLKKEKTKLMRELEEAKKQLSEIGLVEERGGLMDAELRQEFEELRKEKRLLEEKVMQLDTNFPQVLGSLLDVTWKGLQEGYKSASPKDVLQHAIKKNLDAYTAFNELTAAEREQREKAARDAELEKVRKEAKEEARREILKSSVASPDRLTKSTPFFEALKQVESRNSHRDEAIAMLLEEDAS